MTHRFAHAIARDQVGHAELPRHIWTDGGVFHRLGHPLPEVANAPDLLGFIGLKVAAEHPFLRVPHTIGFGHGNDFMDLVDIQVATGSIVMLQQRRDRPVPALQDTLFSGIVGVKIDAAFRSSDVGTGHRKLDLHGFGQALHLPLVQPLPHPGATASGASAQRVNDHPTTGFCLMVFPREHNFRCAAFIGFQEVFHDKGCEADGEVRPNLMPTCPPHGDLDPKERLLRKHFGPL